MYSTKLVQTYFNIELKIEICYLDFSIHNNSLIEQSSDCNQPLLQGQFFLPDKQSSH